MADVPRTGILHFLPKHRVAGGDQADARDLKFFGPSGRTGAVPNNYVIQDVSQIAAELCDYHLDVGKSMGIRRILLDSYAIRIQHQRVIDMGGMVVLPPPLNAFSFTDGTFEGIHESLDAPGGGIINGAFQGDPGPSGGTAWAAVNATKTALETAAGAAQINTPARRTRTFTHDQFLLLNLNFKSPLAQTSTAQVKWTFATQAAREADGVFDPKDIGKVALQTDKNTWWVLKSLAVVTGSSTLKTPAWDSQDRLSQILGGIYNNRNVLFFLPTGVIDPYYAFISPFHSFPATRDIKDQRHLLDIYGDGGSYGFIEKGHRFDSSLIPNIPFGGGFATNKPIDVGGGYVPWWAMIANALPSLTSQNLAPPAGSLGIFNSQAALDAAASSFKNSDVGGFAVVLLTAAYPHGYSPMTTIPVFVKVLLSIGPPVFQDVPGIISAQNAVGSHTDTSYEFYLFRDNPHADFNIGGFRDVDQTYDSIYNPRVTGTFRVQNEERIFYPMVTARVLNTD